MIKDEMIKEKEELLFEDNRTLEDILKEIAEEEGITYEEALKLFKKGLKEAHGSSSTKTKKDKSKAKKKRKMAKASRKRNR